MLLKPNKKVVILLFLLTSINLTNAQNRSKSKDSFVLGTNVIDDSFTLKNMLFNIEEEWNVLPYPSYLAYNRKITDHILFETALTLNHYQKGKLVDGLYLTKEQRYFALDVACKYNLNALNNGNEIIPGIEPFVALGSGITSIDNLPRPTINYGVGLHVWFADLVNCECNRQNNILTDFGLLFQTHGKSSFEQNKYGNQIQHTFGLVYRY